MRLGWKTETYRSLSVCVRLKAFTDTVGAVKVVLVFRMLLTMFVSAVCSPFRSPVW